MAWIGFVLSILVFGFALFAVGYSVGVGNVRAQTANEPSSAAAEGGATAARGGRGGGAAGVTPGAVRCSAIVSRSLDSEGGMV